MIADLTQYIPSEKKTTHRVISFQSIFEFNCGSEKPGMRIQGLRALDPDPDPGKKVDPDPDPRI